MSERHTCYLDGDKHNFEPRYDEEDSGREVNVTNNYVDSENKMSNEEMEELKKLCVLKKYIGDICTWCGKKVEK